jgi:hypothetical protein
MSEPIFQSQPRVGPSPKNLYCCLSFQPLERKAQDSMAGRGFEHKLQFLCGARTHGDFLC